MGRRLAIAPALLALTAVSAPPPPAVASPPTAATGATHGVTSSSVTVTGTLDPGGQNVASFFELGPLTRPFEVTTEPLFLRGAGSLPVQTTLTGLAAGTTYRYQLVAVADDGETACGGERSFATAPLSPTAVDATELTPTSATLRGVVSGGAARRDVVVRVRPDGGLPRANGADARRERPAGGVRPGDRAHVRHDLPVDGLTPFQTYHYRLVVTLPQGVLASNDATFTTDGDILAPTVAIDRPSCFSRPAGHSCAAWRASAAAWRILSGSASDDPNGFAGGLDDVRVRVVRRTGTTCRALTRKAFVQRSCASASRTWIASWQNHGSWMLPLPVLKPDTYEVTVRAFDRSGNTIDAPLTLRIRS